MIAALYVETNGCYYGLDDVDPWDEQRDARLYDGPFPVVAHPPCQRWGKMWMGQPLWVKRTGERKIKGDDGGCFEAALWSVRKFGGILEHPWGSHAWSHFGLHKPSREGGLLLIVKVTPVVSSRVDMDTTLGNQRYYMHLVLICLMLEWGVGEHRIPQWAIDKYGLAYCKKAGELAFRGGGIDSRARIGTPTKFRDLLISIARTSRK